MCGITGTTSGSISLSHIKHRGPEANNWTQGFAIATAGDRKWYEVDNLRIIDGVVV